MQSSDNPRKFFFPGPNIHWLKGASAASMLQSSLAEGEPMIGTFIDPSNLRSLVNDFLGGDHRQSIFLWRLLNTELWMRELFPLRLKRPASVVPLSSLRETTRQAVRKISQSLEHAILDTCRAAGEDPDRQQGQDQIRQHPRQP